MPEKARPATQSPTTQDRGMLQRLKNQLSVQKKVKSCVESDLIAKPVAVATALS
jgi:hypothetical protein